MYRESPAQRLIGELREADERLTARLRAQRRCGQIEGERAEIEAYVRQVQLEIIDEEEGVERLEDGGVRSFLLDLIGHRDNAIDERRRRIAKHQLLLETALAHDRQLQEEAATLRETIAACADAERARRRVLDRMLHHLDSNPTAYDLLPPDVRRLIVRSRQPGAVPVEPFVLEGTDPVREMQEAMAAAAQALVHLSALDALMRQPVPAARDDEVARVEAVLASLATARRSMQTFGHEAIDVYLLAPAASEFAEKLVTAIVDDLADRNDWRRAREHVAAALRDMRQYRDDLERRAR